MAAHELLSIGQLAQQAGCRVHQVAYLCRVGRLESRGKCGGYRVFSPADVGPVKAALAAMRRHDPVARAAPGR